MARAEVIVCEGAPGVLRDRGFTTRLIFLPHLKPIEQLDFDFNAPFVRLGLTFGLFLGEN